jgi:hypothetical protein
VTFEGGRRRDPYGETADAVRRTFTDPAWQTRRMPDAVRAAALANAVDLSSNWTWDEPEPARVVEMVILMAERFEAYLTGEQEADGQG